VKKKETSESNPFLERIGPHDLGDAVDEAREIVDFTAEQVRQARTVLESIQSPVLKAIVVLYVIIGLTGTVIVGLNAFQFWYMFLALFIVHFVFILLYAKAHFDSRRWARGGFLVGNLGLAIFSIIVLEDQISAREIWFGDEVIYREKVGALWIPIVMLGTFVCALLFHFFGLGRPVGRKHGD
jgi:nitric oxide reductase large subunit